MLYLSIFLFLLAIFIVYFYITNPYTHGNIVRRLFETKFDGKRITYTKKYDVKVKNSAYYKVLAFIKCGYYIVSNVYVGGLKTHAKGSVIEIIKEVERSRFNPKKPYLISGDHFNVQFTRNLGVFYYPTLDPRIPFSKEEWVRRQKIYLQSVAYNLEVYKRTGKLATTIVPMGRTRITTLNIYSYPSDSLYALLYGLKSLISSREIEKTLPFKSDTFKLYTKSSGQRLLAEYKPTLQRLLKSYKKNINDPETGFVRSTRHFSAAKDITKRTCSFYDNVIYWKTLKLANELGISEEKGLQSLKLRIIHKFWSIEKGYFIEDLSVESIIYDYYSSDWLCVFFTGFLDIEKPEERKYYAKILEFIHKEKIAEPFPLKYHQDDRENRQFFIVRKLLPEYGGSAIWSFWGIEYIKVLLRMHELTKKASYINDAKMYLKKYERRIIRYRGFPEVYDRKGKMLKSRFYKSIRQTGWVINYEQAKKYLDYLQKS